MSNAGLNNASPNAPIPIQHFLLSSEEETISLGSIIGKMLPANSILCLFGDLGAGKTTLIKGVAAGASGCTINEVSSPTFTYLNVYLAAAEDAKTVYHFDLYRLRDADEFLSMGFDEYFFAGGVCCLEWSEKIEEILPQDCIKGFLKHLNDHERSLSINLSLQL